MREWVRAHRKLAVAVVIPGLVLAVFLLVWFQPQKLFIDDRVDEALPGLGDPVATTAAAPPESPPAEAAATTVPASSQDAGDDDATTSTATLGTATTITTTTTTTMPAGPAVQRRSSLIDVGHAGSGDVLILELPDGSRVIRFEDLDVSNGPDLRVILSRSPLVEDRDAYDDGEFLDLGPLKGNQGNQNYEIPADVVLEDYMTVAIWCRRFNYTFNAAAVR